MSDLENRLPELLDDAVTGEPARRPDFASRAEAAFDQRRARLRRGAGVMAGIALLAGAVVGVAHLPSSAHQSSSGSAAVAGSPVSVTPPRAEPTPGAASGQSAAPSGRVMAGTNDGNYAAWSDSSAAVVVGRTLSIPFVTGSCDGTPRLVVTQTPTVVQVGVEPVAEKSSCLGGAVSRRLPVTLLAALGGRHLVDLAHPAAGVPVRSLTATTATPAGTLSGLLGEGNLAGPSALQATAAGSGLRLRWSSGVCENDQVAVEQTAAAIRYAVVVYATVPADSACPAAAKLHDVTVPLDAPVGSRVLVDASKTGGAVQILPPAEATPQVDGSPAR